MIDKGEKGKYDAGFEASFVLRFLFDVVPTLTKKQGGGHI